MAEFETPQDHIHPTNFARADLGPALSFEDAAPITDPAMETIRHIVSLGQNLQRGPEARDPER
jgi:hypothetical protein